MKWICICLSNRTLLYSLDELIGKNEIRHDFAGETALLALGWRILISLRCHLRG